MAGDAGWDIRQAARGVANIMEHARDEHDAASLTYVAMYACGFSGRRRDLDCFRTLNHLRDESFVARLHHAISDTIDVTGWTVTGHEDERVLLEQDGIRAFVERSALPAPTAPGEPVALKASALRTGVMPSFVVRAGAATSADRSAITRFYLSIRPAGAAWALGTLGRRLDAEGVAYDMKVFAHPRLYRRRDACVFYVPSADEAAVCELLTREVDAVGGAPLRAHGPRLTGRVMPGVHIADEPTDISTEGISHGQWVAGLFFEAAQRSPDARAIVQDVRSRIIDAGRDPDRPHRRGDGSPS